MECEAPPIGYLLMKPFNCVIICMLLYIEYKEKNKRLESMC
ncbi:hypothetical protein SPSP110954_04970 [Sporolactobacillus spathodeae]